MKVLKFIGAAELPEIEYLEETLGLNDSFSVTEMKLAIAESLGFNDVNLVLTEESYSATLGLGDVFAPFYQMDIIESLGLGDDLYQYDRAEIIEQLGLSDVFTRSMTLYVEIDENIGFTDSGFHYLEMDYRLRWRTRTKKLTYGYGAAPFGDQTSYGDGDVISELKEFKVKVIRISDSSTLRTDTITIVNKQFPDGSAQYVYTATMNISDNGYFEPDLRFEVYQVDINDVWSPVKYLDITASTEGGDFE